MDLGLLTVPMLLEISSMEWASYKHGKDREIHLLSKAQRGI